MITPENSATNHLTADVDFTSDRYRELLQLAKSNWDVVGYENIPWGSRFILWRHDIDHSLNRSLTLARIEHELGFEATYFVNPHSEFYNLYELGQYQIVQQILALGHNLGLHFDAAFHEITSEADLDRLVAHEIRNLKDLFGVKPVAFSFHNPVAAHLACEAEQYGGVFNCYSQRFKKEVAYCSDSNGYWRFRRLHDVLTAATDSCLQVLTHPGWWQENPMPPRQRIFRSAYGRAAATVRNYDSGLQEHGRLNHMGAADSLRFLEATQPQLFELCDYLWNQEHFQTLFVELWRLHESQISRLCKAYLRKMWKIPAAEVNAFFSEEGLAIDGWRLFNAIFENQWISAAGVAEVEYKSWVNIRNQLIHGRSSVGKSELETSCAYLCRLMENIASWGSKQTLAYDGLAHLDSVSLPTDKTMDGRLGEKLDEFSDQVNNFPNKNWRMFKSTLMSRIRET